MATGLIEGDGHPVSTRFFRDPVSPLGLEMEWTRWVQSIGTVRSTSVAALAHAICCLLIAIVSVHDAALIVVNHEIIHEMEQNPVGVWLLSVQGGQVWLFVFVKLACTALVCAVLITLFRLRQRIAMTVAGGLVAFQMSLLCYLTFA